MALTAAAVSVAVSSGGGLIHAEYVIVVEGGLAWASLGAGFSVVQVNIDLADWDAFFYGAWVSSAVDVFLRTVNPVAQLPPKPQVVTQGQMHQRTRLATLQPTRLAIHQRTRPGSRAAQKRKRRKARPQLRRRLA